MKNLKINSVFAVFLIAGLSLTLGNSQGAKIHKQTFLNKSNAIFVMKLNLYRELLLDSKVDNDLEDSVEDLIYSEIESIENWANDYYKETVLPNDLKDISLLAQGEHSARIKARMDEMRLVVMGFHKELGQEPTIVNKIDVLKKLVNNLDELLEKQVSELAGVE